MQGTTHEFILERDLRTHESTGDESSSQETSEDVEPDVSDDPSAAESSHSVSESLRGGDDNLAVQEALCALTDGAKIGNLDDEERSLFTPGDVFNLKSPLLLDLLADCSDISTARSNSAATSSAADRTQKTAGARRNGQLPSKAAWDTW